MKTYKGRVYKAMGRFYDDKAIVCDPITSLQGVIDRNGDYIVQPVFTEIWPYEENVARVELNERYGYIDTYGHYIVYPIFDSVCEQFDGGETWVKLRHWVGGIDKYAFILKTNYYER